MTDMTDRGYTANVQNVEHLIKDAGLELSAAEKDFLQRADRIQRATYPQVASTFISSKIIGGALTKHADALGEYAKASEEYTASIKRATWVLAFATIGLVVATVGLVIVSLVGSGA